MALLGAGSVLVPALARGQRHSARPRLGGGRLAGFRARSVCRGRRGSRGLVVVVTVVAPPEPTLTEPLIAEPWTVQ